MTSLYLLVIIGAIAILSIFLISKKIKTTYAILITYSSLLLISTILVGFISIEPENIQIESEAVSQQLNNALKNGDRENIDPLYVMKEESFQIDEEKVLTLKSNYEDGLTFYIERKAENDGQVDSTIYHIGPIVNGHYVENSLEPYELHYSENMLDYYVNRVARLIFHMNTSEFTINQFKHDDVFAINEIHTQAPAVYLQIPKSLSIDRDGDFFIEYVK
ncbi:hypothetical protein [Cytobacillus horneckiae]|uniref:hypothetical protein n=1 Tax=Cytobacillus horneckiae TaxID=549687 RepID=UPI00203D4D40|nr:hypothetical protein [Cytobacillus horneckiae]MCM3180563.1 hypothetical protein [Cytobacillus horneckiae]